MTKGKADPFLVVTDEKGSVFIWIWLKWLGE
jgi:hypothetical protein